MRRSGAEGLVAAGRSLFAERGIGGVSMREIVRQAGHRNTTALKYHFGDRSGLVEAILREHAGRIAERRSAAMDLMPASSTSMRTLACVLVQPVAAQLRCTRGGPEFLQVAAEVLHRTDCIFDAVPAALVLLQDDQRSLQEWAHRVSEAAGSSAANDSLDGLLAVVRFAHVEVSLRARIAASGDVDLFEANLIDMVAALLARPAAYGV